MATASKHPLAPETPNPHLRVAHERAEEELRTACQQYYFAQQSLQACEEDNIQLEGVIKTLEQQIETRQFAYQRLKSAKEELESKVNAARYLPPGTDAETAKKYIAAEREIHTRIALTDASLLELGSSSDKLRGQLDREARTTKVLEGSLRNQVRFNSTLTKSLQDLNERIKHEQGRTAKLKKRREDVDAKLHDAKNQERQLRSSAAATSEMRRRAQQDIRTQDQEVVRVRTDAAFSRRIHVGELEHAHEQETWLKQLLLENRKLKALVESTREGRPALNKFGGGPAVQTSSGSEGGLAAAAAEPVDPNEAPAQEIRGEAVRQVPVNVAGDLSGVLDHVEGSRPPSKRRQQELQLLSTNQRTLEKFRDHNVAMLQQIVSSMTLLQMELDAPTS